MRVVTFNIHHGTVGKEGRVDPEQLGATCAAFEADLIALQEVDLHTYRTGRADLAGVVAAACGMEHAFGPSRRFPGGWYGNALLVRGAIASWSVEPLPRVPRGRWWQERRTVLEAVVEVRGTTLSVSATHLAVPRAVSTVQLHRLLDRARTRPPGLVLGDLNLRPSVVGPVARAAGFELVTHDPTSPATDPLVSIDHVLVSPGLVATNPAVVVTAMSDHAALLVEVAEDVEGSTGVATIAGTGR